MEEENIKCATTASPLHADTLVSPHAPRLGGRALWDPRSAPEPAHAANIDHTYLNI
jgi:hypothetical protein